MLLRVKKNAMDKEKVKIENGKVFSLGKIDMVMIFRKDKDYELECYVDNRIGDTGRLDIGKIASNKKELPEFIFRWDENKEALDVDLCVNDKIDNSLWKQPGCSGHHSKRIISEEGRVFELDIIINNRNIFQGRIRVPVNRKIAF